MEELRRVLTQRLETVPGLLALVVSDRDGVPVLKAAKEMSEIVELCFRHNFLSVFATCSELTSKLFLGPTNFIVASIHEYQVVHCNHNPLVLTLVADDTAVTGQMLNFSQLLKPLLEDIAKIVIC